MKFFKKQPDPFAPAAFGDEPPTLSWLKRTFRHWWAWAILAVVVFVLGTAGYGVWLYFHTQGKLQIELNDVAPKEDQLEPFNTLLVGSDSREGLTEQEQFDLGANAVAGQRADTIILAHIDPAENTVIMVQFPRDLWVPIPGHGENKINSSLEYGPNEVVKTIKALTGLEINHYIQVNIAGFRDLVDAIGGVDVCIPDPIAFDPQTGIEVTPEEVGIVHFDGDRAIRFVRSRHFPTGDFQRIANQQKFVAAAIDKIISSGTLLHPSRITRMARVAGDHVRTDSHTTINGLRGIAQKLRNFDPEHYQAYVAPNFGVGAVGEASVVVANFPAIHLLSEAIKNNESPAEADGVPDIDPSSVSVALLNGSGTPGATDAAAAALQEATDGATGPVEIVASTDAGRTIHVPAIVRYREGHEEEARLVAAAIPGSELRTGKTGSAADVEVLVGPDFETKQLIQIVPIEIPRPSAEPEVCAK